MKGYFNKLLRNTAAGMQSTEFEKRLVKATFHLDSKEPKEKHVQFILEVFASEHLDLIDPETAF